MRVRGAAGSAWSVGLACARLAPTRRLEWWQFDMTWMIIKSLEVVGLAKNVKLPTEAQKRRLLIQPSA